MPRVIHSGAANIVLNTIASAKHLVSDQIIRKNQEYAENPKPASMADVAITVDDGLEFLDALTRYTQLTQDRTFDFMLQGMRATVITIVDEIIDPVSQPGGKDARSAGRLKVVFEHPDTHVMAIFNLDKQKTQGGRPFVLSMPDDELATVIERELLRSADYLLFREFGVTDSVLIPELSYKQKQEFKTSTFKLEHLSLNNIQKSLSISSNFNSQAISFYGSGLLPSVRHYVKKREELNEHGKAPYIGIVYTSSAVSGSSVTNLLSALNGNTSEAIPKLDPINQSHAAWRQAIVSDIAERRNQILRDTGLNFDPANVSGGEIDPQLYPEAIVGFILSAKDPVTRANRKEFVDNLYIKLYGTMIQASVALSDERGERRCITLLIQGILRDVKGGRVAIPQPDGSSTFINVQSAIEAVDARVFPKEPICLTLGLPVMSNKEFDAGMRIMGMDGIMNTFSASKYNDVFRTTSTSRKNISGMMVPLCSALSMAKLNPGWLKNSDDSKLPYFFEHDRNLMNLESIRVPAERNKLEKKLKAIQNAVIPFLVSSGQAISQAQFAGDKTALKSIGQKMTWLSQRKSSVVDTLLKMDEKYKIEATYRDYSKILEQLVESYMLRTICSTDLQNKNEFFSVFSANEHFEMSVIENNVTKSFFNHLDDNAEAEYDEENDEYFEPERAEDIFSPLSMSDERSVHQWLTKQQYAFKDILDLNDRLHKDYSTILRRLNAYSDKNFEWSGFIDKPFSHTYAGETLTAHVINSRIDLLEEGNMMGHCVFSYLSRCMSGESVIFSVRDELGDRVATIELAPEQNNEDDELPYFTLSQCFARHNTDAPAAARALASELVEQLNNRVLSFNPILGMSDEHRDVFDHAVENIETDGDLFKSIPYNSDAAYLLEEEIEKYLPAGVSLDAYFEEYSGCFTEMQYHSAFSTEMKILNKLKSDHAVDISILLQFKDRLNLRSIEAISSQIEQIIPSYTEIADRKRELARTSLSEDQIIREISHNAGSLTILAQCEPHSSRQNFARHGQHPQLDKDALNAFLMSDGHFGDFLKHFPICMVENLAPTKQVDVTPQNTARSIARSF